MCCLSLIEATETLKQQFGNFPGGGAFQQLFGPVRVEFEQNFPQIQMPGGDVEGTLVSNQTKGQQPTE